MKADEISSFPDKYVDFDAELSTAESEINIDIPG